MNTNISTVGAGTAAQLSAGIWFALVALALESAVAPFKNPAENKLQFAAQGTIAVTLVLGNIIMASEKEGGQDIDAEAVGVFLITINAVLLAAFGTLFVLNAEYDGNCRSKYTHGQDGRAKSTEDVNGISLGGCSSSVDDPIGFSDTPL